MKIKKLESKIETLEEICKIFLTIKEASSDEPNENISLKIKAFDEIVKDCKNELLSSDYEGKIKILKLLYGFDDLDVALNDSLDYYMKGQADIEPIKQFEHNINSLKDLEASIETMIVEIASYYKNLEQINKKLYRFEGTKLRRYKKCLDRLLSLKDDLSLKLEGDSKEASFLMSENFYSIYIFFSFLISLATQKKKEMLLIEIASRLDGYIEMIKPSFGSRSLHHDDMLYHYILYEINELREQIFKELS